ncbi:oligosaccharide flippase family protein [Vibrio tritonius]|uniref:oligosaccharide flippase family protein n=1 Tax=Vibrio tritonius TaxID=1435069 RepID=UPI00315DB3B3
MNKLTWNIIWLIFDKLITLLGGFLITVLTARYLGPEKIGIINYFLAILAFIVPITQFGGDILIFLKSAKNEQTGKMLINHTKNMRRLLFTVSFAAIYLFTYQEYNQYDRLVLVILGVASFYQSYDLYKFYFNGVMRSKENVISGQVGLLASLLLRSLFVFLKLPYYFFALPYVALYIIPFWYRRYRIKAKGIETAKYATQFKGYFLKNGLPILISSLSILVYIKVGQIMLGTFLSNKEVGLYTSALTLAQCWQFVPLALIMSFISKSVSSSTFKDKGFRLCFLASTFCSVPFLLATYFFATPIIEATFGAEFLEAQSLLFLLTLTTMFSLYGTISSRIIIEAGGNKYMMMKSLVVSIMSVGLSYWFVKEYGLIGAGYAALISEAISGTVGNYFFRKSNIFKLQYSMLMSKKDILSFVKG